MRGKIVAVQVALATMLGLAFLAQPVLAQFRGVNADQQKKDYDAAKKKPDDSQYKAAVERIPENNKKFDPWANLR